MRRIYPIVLFISLPIIAFGQRAENQSRLDYSQDVILPKRVPPSSNDLAVLEAVLSDIASDKQFKCMIFDKNDLNQVEKRKIIVYNEGIGAFRSKNANIITSDLKAFSSELKYVRSLPDYEPFESQSVWNDIFTKYFPGSKALIFVHRRVYPKMNTAILEFTSGPEAHGDASNKYTLTKRNGKWIIVAREHHYTQ